MSISTTMNSRLRTAAAATLSAIAAGVAVCAPAQASVPTGPTGLAPAPGPVQPAPNPNLPPGPGNLAPDPDAANLTRTYLGNDGSHLFTRRVGDRVTGFGEHRGAAYVVDGRIEDGKITGSYWDVAKAPRTASGGFELVVAANGTRLSQTGSKRFSGASTYKAVDRIDSLYRWSRADFQSLEANDLDGAFKTPGLIPGGRRAYLRQAGDTVVGIVENGFGDGAKRPNYAVAFVGNKSGSTFAGRMVGLSKGGMTFDASFTAKQAADRSFTMTAVHPDGDPFMVDVPFVPDYAVDLAKFGDNLREALSGKAVGWAFAITSGGKVVAKWAGGRSAVKNVGDSGKTDRYYSSTTENEIASTSKTVTAVAVARALYKRGTTLDERVAPYLPKQWKLGKGMDQVTFRQMLRHVGLKHPGNVCSTNPYECLKRAVEAGITSAPGYNNIHFTLMRVVLPFIVKKAQMQAVFDKKNNDGAERNAAFSKVFRDYTVTMLDSIDIEGDFAFRTDNFAYGYKFGPPITGGVKPGGSELSAGSGGLRITAEGFTRFLAKFDAGGLVPRSVAEDMKSDRVGFDNQKKDFDGPGATGDLITKNGGTSYVGSQLMIYPSDVQAFVSVNSTGNSAGSLKGLLRTAWRKALV